MFLIVYNHMWAYLIETLTPLIVKSSINTLLNKQFFFDNPIMLAVKGKKQKILSLFLTLTGSHAYSPDLLACVVQLEIWEEGGIGRPGVILRTVGISWPPGGKRRHPGQAQRRRTGSGRRRPPG
jgi:hypothetical protein